MNLMQERGSSWRDLNRTSKADFGVRNGCRILQGLVLKASNYTFKMEEELGYKEGYEGS